MQLLAFSVCVSQLAAELADRRPISHLVKEIVKESTIDGDRVRCRYCQRALWRLVGGWALKLSQAVSLCCVTVKSTQAVLKSVLYPVGLWNVKSRISEHLFDQLTQLDVRFIRVWRKKKGGMCPWVMCCQIQWWNHVVVVQYIQNLVSLWTFMWCQVRPS